MNKPELIVIHCSADYEGSDKTIEDIDRQHRAKGWNGCGYHYVIDIFGNVGKGRDESRYGAHAYGHNKNSIGICYVGGLDARGKGKDTRTLPQITALRKLVDEIKSRHNIKKVCGHRDLSPDIDGDGIIEKWEWMKECPCFDVKTEL